MLDRQQFAIDGCGNEYVPSHLSAGARDGDRSAITRVESDSRVFQLETWREMRAVGIDAYKSIGKPLPPLIEWGSGFADVVSIFCGPTTVFADEARALSIVPMYGIDRVAAVPCDLECDV